jgi:hypothetical protein
VPQEVAVQKVKGIKLASSANPNPHFCCYRNAGGVNSSGFAYTTIRVEKYMGV